MWYKFEKLIDNIDVVLQRFSRFVTKFITIAWIYLRARWTRDGSAFLLKISMYLKASPKAEVINFDSGFKEHLGQLSWTLP